MSGVREDMDMRIRSAAYEILKATDEMKKEFPSVTQGKGFDDKIPTGELVTMAQKSLAEKEGKAADASGFTAMKEKFTAAILEWQSASEAAPSAEAAVAMAEVLPEAPSEAAPPPAAETARIDVDVQDWGRDLQSERLANGGKAMTVALKNKILGIRDEIMKPTDRKSKEEMEALRKKLDSLRGEQFRIPDEISEIESEKTAMEFDLQDAFCEKV
jgi:predicted nuclease with TOPRIM domain